MSVFCCPQCGKDSPIFGAHGTRDLAASLGYDLLAEVPLEMPVREHTDSGMPVVIAAPDSKAAAAYRGLASQVWERLQRPAAVPSSVKIVFE